MNDIYGNIDELNFNKKRKTFDLILWYENRLEKKQKNKQANAIVTEFFIRGIKLDISLVFATEFYFNYL